MKEVNTDLPVSANKQETEKPEKKTIDKKKMIIYSELMKPKFEDGLK